MINAIQVRCNDKCKITSLLFACTCGVVQQSSSFCHIHTCGFCIDMSPLNGNQGAWPIRLIHIPSSITASPIVGFFILRLSSPFAMHHRYLVACVLSFLLPASSVLADKSAQQYLSEGNQFLSTGKLNDALISFDAAIGKGVSTQHVL